MFAAFYLRARMASMSDLPVTELRVEFDIKVLACDLESGSSGDMARAYFFEPTADPGLPGDPLNGIFTL